MHDCLDINAIFLAECHKSGADIGSIRGFDLTKVVAVRDDVDSDEAMNLPKVAILRTVVRTIGLCEAGDSGHYLSYAGHAGEPIGPVQRS